MILQQDYPSTNSASAEREAHSFTVLQVFCVFFSSLKQLLTLLRASMLLMDVKWIFGRALTTINN